MPRKIRILIADDHFMARMGLALPIGQEPDMEVVAEAQDGAEAQAAFLKHLPDVTLLDYRLPDMDGPDVAAAIRAMRPDAKIIILSAFEGEESIFRAHRAGVRGYLPKTSACGEVLQAIRSVCAGGAAFPPAIEAKIRARSSRNGLGQREIRILKLITQGNSNKEIAHIIGFSESLIKQELVRVFTKLGARDRAHAATLAIERGIVDV